jgi:hypothetical protein
MEKNLNALFDKASALNNARSEQAAAFEALLAGPAQETISALKSLKAAGDSIVKEAPWYKRWGQISEHALTYQEGGTIEAADGHLEKAFRLKHANSDRGLQFIFRDNATMQISPIHREFFKASNARYGEHYDFHTKVGAAIYDDKIDTAKTQEVLAGFLSRFQPAERDRLQAKLAKPGGPQPG